MLYNSASADKVNLRRAVATLEKSPQFDGFTRVELIVDKHTSFVSGSSSGRTLRVDCPWGSQQIANNILASIKGYQYQPFTAPGAMLDPSVELMDGVTVDSTYGGIYSMELEFGPGFRADLSAPFDEETDHEYPYKPQKDRRVDRQMDNMSSELRIQADQIAARVEKTGGEGGSFSWEMEWDHHSWEADGQEVFRLDKFGACVTGEIRATSGRIGGFTILPDRLSYNGQDWGGSNSRGAYLGPEGLQLGSWEHGCHIDSFGHIYAESGEFRGSVRAGMIDYGGNAGYFNGAGLSSGSVSGGSGGAIGSGTITTGNTSWGINTSLGYADFSDDVFHNVRSAPYVSCDTVYANDVVIENKLKLGWWTVSRQSVFVDGKKIQYLGWS